MEERPGFARLALFKGDGASNGLASRASCSFKKTVNQQEERRSPRVPYRADQERWPPQELLPSPMTDSCWGGRGRSGSFSGLNLYESNSCRYAAPAHISMLMRCDRVNELTGNKTPTR